MGALGVFGLCQIVAFTQYVRSRLSPAQFETLYKFMLYVVGATVAGIVAFLTLAGMYRISRIIVEVTPVKIRSSHLKELCL